MTVLASSSGIVELTGECPVEDAEALLRQLLSSPGATVDWSGCDFAHTAVVQVLLSAKPTLVGTPRSRFLAEKIAPQLRRTR